MIRSGLLRSSKVEALAIGEAYAGGGVRDVGDQWHYVLHALGLAARIVLVDGSNIEIHADDLAGQIADSVGEETIIAADIPNGFR